MNLLRIEGVNHAHCIGDTEDLATRRGGGLMLLNATDAVAQALQGVAEAVSTGASAGLFRITDSAGADDGTLERVRTTLAGEVFRNGTFVVSRAVGADFPRTEQQALNHGRWQQMQRLSFSTAGLKPTQAGACEVDRVRPVASWRMVGGEADTGVSLSVAERRSYGNQMKQRFYRRELEALPATDRPDGWDEALRYTHTFEQLSCGPRQPADSHLDGKMAVFYADGNSFGAKVAACTTPAALTAWESFLKKRRRRFLARLIERARGDSRWQNAGEIRLETPLWGGDEFMLIVPAWCGFELAQLFLDEVADLRYPETDRTDASRLTHACGLVFCSHKTPISHIAALAKRLAEQGKQDGKADDILNWLVLESLDHAGDSLAQYLKQRFPDRPDMTWKALALEASTLDTLRTTLPALKDELPRSAITRAARMLAAGSEIGHDLLKASYAQVSDAMKGTHADAWQKLWQALHPDRPTWSATPSPADLPAWLKLIETWDYVVEGGQA
ncbi:hypothetical protein X805_35700 [Sphaerotilus natans subsp. natans DSM 6575]|uniref:GGDEF domain-containing protein n=1 Tax=Sphaerotilus natans subsp. natans DSM 6575 TaxID=1286631 RepID=A0A059KH89_9BURK|nr:hypothetical protein [Sphaerotilus natans]KDB50826.1 hypothetical protein X805_35700 [Sphaerotilus natans subsp. natans DSM 6575]SIR98119.1 hypothetical protein SAMN05421778_12531 [Sphaerotilus natans]